MSERRQLGLPERVVVGGVLVLFFFVIGPFFGDGRKNTRRARDMVARFCGENDACVQKGEEHLEECVDASSTRSGKSSISFDETAFSECIRGYLGFGKPHHP